MNNKSKIIEKLINESIESRIDEIAKKISQIDEVDNFDLEVGSEYEYKKNEDSKSKMITFLKRGKNSSHGPFYFLDRNGNEIMLGEKQLKKMEKKHTKQEETEGNAFTKKLKDTPKGEKFKMGNKEYTDNSSLEEMIHSELEEKLYGGQKKLDKNHNGRIDSEDFKMLRKSKKSEMDEDLGGMDDENPNFGKMNLSNRTKEDEEIIAKYNIRNPLSLKDNKKEEEEEDFGTRRSRFFDMEDQEDEWKEKMGNIEESDKKFIQRATEKMEKKGTKGSFKEYCGGEVTKKCIDKAMKSEDSELVKKANFAKNIKAYAGAKHKDKMDESLYNIKFNGGELNLTETELVDLIEELVVEEKSNSKGMQVYNKVSSAEKKQNEKAISDVKKKMKDYVDGEYEENPKDFPTGNGQSKKDKKEYIPSDEVDEYIDAYAYPGQTNLVFDEIKPDEGRIKKYLEGDRTTGNAEVDEDGNPYGNVVPSNTGKKFMKNYKNNLYGQEQMNASYKRYPQETIEVSGENTKSKRKQTPLSKLGESIEEEKSNLISEEMKCIKDLISYMPKPNK